VPSLNYKRAMGDRNMENVGMTNDLERGRSKDLTVYDQTNGAAPTSTLIDTRPKHSTSHKYLLLGVFCLGVFIDG
jgi:hypothetical protein